MVACYSGGYCGDGGRDVVVVDVGDGDYGGIVSFFLSFFVGVVSVHDST